MSHCIALFVTVAALAAAGFAPAAQAQKAPGAAEQLHARAEDSFQQGRFPDAYGRFIALADAGHAPAAEVAMFMYLHGTTLFRNDWDITQDQLTAWAALIGRPAPVRQRRWQRADAPPRARHGPWPDTVAAHALIFSQSSP